MKRIAALLMALVFAVTLAAPAEGATLAQRVKKLERKVRTLEAQQRNLNTRLQFAEGVTNCVAYAVPLSYYGDALYGAFGYRFYNGDGLPEFYTTAVDFSGTGEVPDIWVAGFSFSPLCVPATARPRATGTASRLQAFAPGVADRTLKQKAKIHPRVQ